MEASFSKLSLEENDTKISAEKDKIRHNVWSKLEKKRQIRAYPPSCFGKIPNFKGTQHAAERVTKLNEFRNAKVIKSIENRNANIKMTPRPNPWHCSSSSSSHISAIPLHGVAQMGNFVILCLHENVAKALLAAIATKLLPLKTISPLIS